MQRFRGEKFAFASGVVRPLGPTPLEVNVNYCFSSLFSLFSKRCRASSLVCSRFFSIYLTFESALFVRQKDPDAFECVDAASIKTNTTTHLKQKKWGFAKQQGANSPRRAQIPPGPPFSLVQKIQSLPASSFWWSCLPHKSVVVLVLE